MDQIRIAADSSCDLLTMDGVDFVSVPLTVRTAVEEFRDDAALDVDAMVTTLRGTKGRHLQRLPEHRWDWESAFWRKRRCTRVHHYKQPFGQLQRGTCRKETLRGAESLSPHFCGGHAVRRSGDRPAHRKVSRRTALRQELRGGLHSRTAVSAPYPSALCAGTMHNLAQNGRISKLAATMAGVLGIRAVGQASEEGTLEMLGKCRGARKTQELLLSEMVRLGYRGGSVRIGIAGTRHLHWSSAPSSGGDFRGRR